MINNILKIYGLSIDIMEKLSFESKLDISLKNNLHYFDKDILFNEIKEYIDFLDESEILPNISIDYRIKSIDSVLLKYQRYFPDHQCRKVFNDILGFRALCDNYDEIIDCDEKRFRIANMSHGKSIDDGYRGVHIYFQAYSKCYPIEMQFNTFYDRQLNDWLHKYIYKRNINLDIGRLMREKYENGMIINESQFREELDNVLSDS